MTYMTGYWRVKAHLERSAGGREKCVFEAAVYELFPEGQVPETVEIVANGQ
jgi:hypothetical protein